MSSVNNTSDLQEKASSLIAAYLAIEQNPIEKAYFLWDSHELGVDSAEFARAVISAINKLKVVHTMAPFKELYGEMIRASRGQRFSSL